MAGAICGAGKNRLWPRLAATATSVSMWAGTLYFFPPDRFSFYPICPIHQYTGLLCPGCGGTRALAALLHGQVAEAFHWNALLVLLLPIALLYGGFALRRQWLGRAPERAAQEGVFVALAIAAAGFAVGRNLL